MTSQQAPDKKSSHPIEFGSVHLGPGAGTGQRPHSPDRNRDAETASVLDEYVLWQRARGLSEKTITERVRIIRRIPDPFDLTAVDIDRFLANEALARSSRATYHGAIRAWHRWLVRTQRRPDDPTLIATPPKVPRGHPRPVANEHLTVLLASHLYRRTRCMVLLAAYAGLRVGEIAAIRGEHVDTIVNSISILGKGGKCRQVPLHPLLQRAAQQMPPRTWWFPSWTGNYRYRAGGPVLANSVSACISKAMDRAGVPGTPHALRHWFGSALRESGVDSLVIKELMGHESLATTAIYVRVPVKQRIEAVDSLPDLA